MVPSEDGMVSTYQSRDVSSTVSDNKTITLTALLYLHLRHRLSSYIVFFISSYLLIEFE